MFTTRKRRGTLVALASGLAAAALALTGCAAPSTTAQGTDGDLPSKITIADHAIPQSLDPIVSSSYETTQLTFLWAGYLTNYDEGERSGTPQLAESIEESADGMTWTITLQPDLKFSDGSDLTSEDVVASLDRIHSTPNIAADNWMGPAIGSIETIEATDDLTVTLHMNRTYAAMDQALSVPQMVILPAEGIAAGDEFWKSPISAGRFKFDQIDTTNGNFSLSANPHYYDDSPKQITEVEFVSITDAGTRMAQLQSGQVDYADNIPGHLLAQVGDEFHLDTAKWNGGQMALSVNFNDPIASDERIRQAISLVVDRQEIVDTALGGEHVGLPLYGIPWNQDGVEPNAPAFEPDAEAARELLKGTACENGCTIPLITVTDSAWQVPLVAEVVQQQAQEIGINLEIENSTFTQVGDRLAQGNWGFFTRWIGYYETTPTYLGGYVYGDPDSGNNADFWGTNPSEPDMPKLKELSDQLKAATEDEMPALVEQINDEYGKMLPSIPLTTLSYVGVSRYPVEIVHSVGCSYMVLP